MPHPLAIAAAAALTALAPTAAGTWRTVLPPQHTEGYLNAVSCAGSTCLSVGAFSNSADPSMPFPPQSLRLTAGRWNPVSFPANAEPRELDCSSPTVCLAVGSLRTTGDPEPHAGAWLWNGTRWRPLSVPRPAGELQSDLGLVSCTTASNCVVVGSYTDQQGQVFSQSQRWDGSAWHRVPIAQNGATLFGISCTSATSCLGVGAQDPADIPSAYAARYDGKRWTASPTPTAPAGQTLDFSDVSCPTASSCVAAGTVITADNTGGGPYLARWNGAAWSRIPLPKATGLDVTGLRSVSCASTRRCVVVGNGTTSSYQERSPLFGTTDGRTWSIEKTPPVASDAEVDLPDISCATVCAAVGSHYDPSLPALEEYALVGS